AEILDALQPTTERAVKNSEQLFYKLKINLDVHAAIEEEIFYPALEQAEETRSIALEAIEEHRIVKELLAALTSLSKDSEEWTAKMTVLKENVEHHVEEEENEMFKKARKVLTDEEADDLGTRMEAAKKQFSATAR
ncbi:MAG: hemerythrin domain-containing protein, partial [Blastocatellia bacterium]